MDLLLDPQINLLIHFIATAAMTGVIWFVQIVHYPLLGAVGTDAFVAYERAHVSRVTYIVAPLMLAEVASGATLVLIDASELFNRIAWIALALTLVNWLSTALIQVPCHERLSNGFEPRIHARLVRTNWIRTVGWSLRLALATWMSLNYEVGAVVG